ncbi:hypothetical protein [Desulfofalx alkaliphila]|uniref:hypothetical protein n=1 Tax=Desulfofalx alkaliphila TaxID=105483 RepID=UPI0004E1003C|nr:hypothetical protein [Desulfofalx alkaliphila]
MEQGYVVKIGIGSSEIEGQQYAVLMLDHIDFDNLLRTATIMEFMKPNLTPLKPEHPLYFGAPTEVLGMDQDLEVAIKKVKKMITIKISSRSILDDLIKNISQEQLEKAKKNLPSVFFDFNRHKKYLDQKADMIYSGVYKDSYRNFIKSYQEKGFYIIILGNNGTPMPGVQLVKEDLKLE